MLPHLPIPEFVDLVHQSVQEIAVVGNDEQRPVKGLERLLQHVLRLDVHVVGRLVEDQEVVALQHQFRHPEPGPLAAAQHRHALVDVFPAEEERSQDIPQFCADIPHRDPVQGTEDGLLFVEHIFLVLSVVTYVYIMSYFRFAGERLQLAGDRPDQGGLALAVASDQGHFLPALDLHVGVRKDHLARVPHGQVRRLVGHVAAALRRRELERDARVVRLIDFQTVQALQRLDARLHLVGLGRLVAEFIDKLLGLLDHPLLVLVGGRLLGQALGAQRQILAVGHFIVMDVPQHDLHGARGHIVQELPVVADQQDGGAAPLQVILQPLDGLDVQVVGRLVEQHQVRAAEQDLGQLDAHVPALAESLGLAAQLIVPETQARQGPARLHLDGLRLAHGDMVVELVETGDQREVFR